MTLKKTATLVNILNVVIAVYLLGFFAYQMHTGRYWQATLTLVLAIINFLLGIRPIAKRIYGNRT